MKWCVQVKGTWAKESTQYGYDFWYQPRHNIMVSSQWGDPKEFVKVGKLLAMCTRLSSLHTVASCFLSV